MKRTIPLLAGLMFLAMFSFAQVEKKTEAHVVPGNTQVDPQMNSYAHVILGIGQSDDKIIFEKVKQYLTVDLSETVSCSFFCMQQRLFSIDLISVQLKDPGEFIKKLKIRYPGTDFLIKANDNIMFNECAAEIIKQQ